jgi:DNA ligase-1
MKPFKPMLACAIEESDLDKLRYPVIVQPKIDGIRCVVIDGVAYSRSMKLIPNRFIQRTLKKLMPFGSWDGELILQNSKATFQDITSAVMSEDKEPGFTYWIFDAFLDTSYLNRYNLAERTLTGDTSSYTGLIENIEASSKEQVIATEEELVEEQGCEGIIIRSPTGFYKQGRSTFKEQYLLKLKRFTDAEAEVLGMEPLMVNTNEQETDERGYAKRSKEKAGLVAVDRMGKLLVRGINGEFKGVEFKIGSGFTERDRIKIFGAFKENQDKLFPILHPVKGSILKYKYFKVGCKDKPRHPIFTGFRQD